MFDEHSIVITIYILGMCSGIYGSFLYIYFDQSPHLLQIIFMVNIVWYDSWCLTSGILNVSEMCHPGQGTELINLEVSWILFWDSWLAPLRCVHALVNTSIIVLHTPVKSVIMG